ncbi:unnamed protein product [Jaminaea pallidilutea]
MSEIDAIFGGGAGPSKSVAAPVDVASQKKNKKGRAKDAKMQAANEPSHTEDHQKSKASKSSVDDGDRPSLVTRKPKQQALTEEKEAATSKRKDKKRVPTVIEDPSLELGAEASGPGKRTKKSRDEAPPTMGRPTPAKGKKAVGGDADLAGFMDSRGSKRGRTEEGYAIYSAEELKISKGAGDTPLCPFDCTCCF